MTGRIYIRDFSYEATAADLQTLISKVCPVEEVYISKPTPTGINRSFAIVVVNASDKLIEKCIKTFNNCHWKGTRIYVEKAKEYYKDRFARERAIERRKSAKVFESEDDAAIDTFEEELLQEIESEELKDQEEDSSDEGDAEPSTASSGEPSEEASGKVEDDETIEKKVLKAAVKSSIIKIKKSRDAVPMAISMVPATSSSTSSSTSGTAAVHLYCITAAVHYIMLTHL